jgi:hypothetical protein
MYSVSLVSPSMQYPYPLGPSSQSVVAGSSLKAISVQPVVAISPAPGDGSLVPLKYRPGWPSFISSIRVGSSGSA